MTTKELMNATSAKMFNIYDRWLDEHEYEDFKDYADYIKKIVSEFKDITFIKGTKMPFGFKFKFDEKLYQYRVTAKEISIKTIIK